MKTPNLLSVVALILFFTSCSSTKNITNEGLFNTTWELEYLSGPRIAFDGLYPDKKPQITFNKTTQKVEGNNGCNGYAADYTLDGNNISFGEPGPTTMMYCGEGEEFFLNTIKKVNRYKIVEDGKLNLMIDDVTMMRFKKNNAIMKHTLPVLICFFSFVMLSCADKITPKSAQERMTIEKPDSTQTSSSLKSKNENAGSIYFKASGTEPFWGLELSENQIKLKAIGDSLVTPHTLPAASMDANVKMYKLQTESVEMSIQIAQSKCTNAMSGKVSPYAVNINYKKNRDEAFTTVEGCGHYITDYRLHDIWVLEELNGKKISKKDFNKEFPAMEINSTTNKFSGFTGCNRMNGRLFYEKVCCALQTLPPQK